jgi:diphosphomevalonate decarboxylase
MTERDFVLRISEESLPEEGTVTWSSPSNIALVKYWGKKEHQIPANPSISFTLDQCKTITELQYRRHDSKDFSFEVFLRVARSLILNQKLNLFKAD